MQIGEQIRILRAGVIEQVNHTADAALLDLIYKLLAAERENHQREQRKKDK